MSDERSFSKRFNYKSDEPPIRVREDAPEALRFGLVMLADHLGLSPHDARLEVCSVLLQRPDPSNWTAYPNVFDEVQHLVEAAPWYRVYDIAEDFFTRIAASNHDRGVEFADRLNELLREHGIGWEMRSGKSSLAARKCSNRRCGTTLQYWSKAGTRQRPTKFTKRFGTSPVARLRT